MRDSLRPAAAILLAAALAGCAGGGAAVPLPSAPARPDPEALSRVPRGPVESDAAGVLGSDAATLRARFGEPRIDLDEGEARKLQFAGSDCVLDIYLYPPRPGDAPVATYVEARLRQGGGAIPRDACLAAIEGGR